MAINVKLFITRKLYQFPTNLFRENNISVEVWPKDTPIPYAKLIQIAGEYDAFITMLNDQIDQNFFEHAKKLKALCNYAVGYNNIDVSYAKKKEIPLGHTPDVLSEATAELALALMLNSARNLHTGHQEMQKLQFKGFSPQHLLGHGLNKKKLGILGLGRIGQKLAHKCVYAFDMQILYWGQSKKSQLDFDATFYEKLDEMLPHCDFISIHLPLNAETKNLFSSERFKLLKTNCIIVNTARGAIIDEKALYFALENKSIFAASVDVSHPEPMKKENPLLQHPNFFITPHIGSANFETREKMSTLCAENIVAALKGKIMPNAIY